MKKLLVLIIISLSSLAQDYNSQYALGLKIGTDSSLNFRMPFKKYDFIQADLHKLGENTKLSSSYNTYLKSINDFDPYVGVGFIIGDGASGLRIPIGANYKLSDRDLLLYGEASGDVTGDGLGINVAVGLNYLF